MAFDGRCGSCKGLNTDDYIPGRDTNCKCNWRGGYHELTEKKCYKHEYDPGKDYDDLEKRAKYCRWHIVTAIFRKLGLKDDYECIALLHGFREDYLEKNDKYRKFLNAYDIEGPKLAELILKDKDSEELCRNIVQNVLVHILDCIRKGDNEKAFEYYIQMLSILKQRYEEYFTQSEEEQKNIKSA